MENSNFSVPAQDFFPSAPRAGKAILLQGLINKEWQPNN